ncbi:hypothetical protein EYR40_008063 [Pleurotus pulmonarius]|nr:hypothetical protein EYR38_007628 [Pleurotus pulmonarius]KAF4597601.1 hypothetical protein EYR40_008063 [Pleurotus pulmonarius]
MPPAPKSPSTAAKKAGGGAPKAKGAVRAKSGCYTCRIRRKKCDEQPNEQGFCQTCVRLRLECLGFGAKRPEWLRESRNVTELREKIKGFLASQGMIKGHSGSGPRTAEQEPQILRLNDDAFPAQPIIAPHLALSDPHRGDPNRVLLPPFNNLSAVRETWAVHPHPPLGYPNVAPPPHDMRPGTPGSPYYHHSPESAQAQPVFTSPSLSSNSLAFYQPPRYSSKQPWLHSSFGPHYHGLVAFDADEYDDSQVDPALLAVNNGMLSYTRDSPEVNLSPNPEIDGLVGHYMSTVVGIQYLLANKSETARMIFNTVQNFPLVRNAVRLLASVHQHKRGTKADDMALLRVESNAFEIYNDLTQQLIPGPLSQRRQYIKEDAMTALLIISSVLFDGGMGNWHMWLHVAYAYVDSIFRQYNNPADALARVNDEKMSFIIKTTLWFDVIASVTTQEPPHYLDIIDELFSPEQARIDEGYGTVSMLDVMGCDNNTFWAMARTSALSCWKQDRISKGSLSVPELVTKGSDIEQALTHAYYPTQQADAEDEDICRIRTAEIFRASTLAWLHSIISGDRPNVPEVANAVQTTLKCLTNIPSNTPHEKRLERSIVRSTVFSIFMCGVFATKRQDRMLLLSHLGRQSEDNVGNCTAISRLMKQIWEQCDRDGRKSVKWREPLKISQILLV